MNILYLANIRLPTEKAHGIQIMKSCEAFSAAGHLVELAVPHRRTPINENPFVYYAVQAEFPVRRLFTLDTVRFGRIGFLIQAISFAVPAALFARRKKPSVVYTRDEIVAVTALFMGVQGVVWESHDGAWNPAARYAARHSHKVVVVTEGAKEFYVSKGISEEKIAAVPNGVEVEAFSQHEPRSESRRRLGIPEDTRVALYVGALDGWKGTDTLLEASQFLQNGTIAIIGGTPARVSELEKKYPAVLFLGPRPFRELSDNLTAADVCVLPNTAKDPIAVTFTCPLKLLAYMAAGMPIVATDLPTTRELAGGDAALLVPPDNPKALAEGIERVLNNSTLAQTLARRAAERAKLFSWTVRAKRLIGFLEENR